MTLPSHGRQTGSLAPFMAALIVVSALGCGAVLFLSVETYRASASIEFRLQERAAAEGAVVLLAARRGDPGAEAIIGPSRVRFESAATAGDRIKAPFLVEILGADGTTVRTASYTASFVTVGDRSWSLERLEKR